MHNFDSLRAGDVGDSGTIAGACVSLVGLVILDGWEVAATAASSRTAKVARGQGRRPRQATGGTTLMRGMTVSREHATTHEQNHQRHNVRTGGSGRPGKLEIEVETKGLERFRRRRL